MTAITDLTTSLTIFNSQVVKPLAVNLEGYRTIIFIVKAVNNHRINSPDKLRSDNKYTIKMRCICYCWVYFGK